MNKVAVMIMIHSYLLLTAGLGFAMVEREVEIKIGEENWGIDSCPIVQSSIAEGRFIMGHDCDNDGEADKYCVYGWDEENHTTIALKCLSTSELLPGTFLKGSLTLGTIKPLWGQPLIVDPVPRVLSRLENRLRRVSAGNGWNPEEYRG